MTATHPEAALSAQKIDHEFKSHPDVFWPAALGEKSFEFRKDDRGGYHVGQTVRLRCYDPDHGFHGHPPLDRRITNILRGGEFGLQEGYCILGLAPLSTAHTATAGDGGERVRHVKRGTEYEVLHRGVNLQVAVHKRLLDDWALALVEGDKLVVYQGADGKLWAREEAEFRDGRFETIAQAPAVQAPAGEALREATEILISALDECGEIFGTIRDDYTDPRRECREGRERAAEALKAARALLAASPTPTDAQPKAARPVGDEALRDLLREAIVFLEMDDEANTPGTDLYTWVKVAAEAVAAHPTTGQETVATPDGAIREALGTLNKATASLTIARQQYWKDHEQTALKEQQDATQVILDLIAALSAPGSAGSGDTPKDPVRLLKEALFACLKAGTGDTAYGGVLVAPGKFAHVRFTIEEATPSPAQEPGTGDTGEAGRPIEEAPRDGTPIIAWGAPSSRYPDEREWRETRWTLYGEGSPAHAAHKAGKGPEGYWDWSEPHSNWGASWKPTRFIPLPTPATKAETRGPAEGAR